MHEWLKPYSIGCYIDAKHHSKSWKVAKIISISDSSLCVTFDGWPDENSESFDLDSMNLAPFRKHSSLYTGPKDCERELDKTTEDIKNLSNQLKDLPSSAFEITQLLRGSSFIVIDQLLDWKSESLIENEVILSLFSTFLTFFVDFLEKAGQFFEFLHQDHLNFENHFEVAFVLSWPEVCQTARKLLGLETRSFKVLSMMKHVPSYYKFSSFTADKKTTLSYLVNLFASLSGFDRMLELVSVTESSKMIPLKFLLDLPSLDLMSYFSQTFDSKWSPMFKDAALNRVLRIELEELATINCEELVVFIEKLGKIRGRFSEDMVIIRLTIANLFLQTINIKTRLLGIVEINKIVEKHGQVQLYNELKVDDETLVKCINSLEIVKFLLNDSHVELIRKSFGLFNFLASQKAFNCEIVELLWKNCFDHSAEEFFFELFLTICSHLTEDLKSSVVFCASKLDSLNSFHFLADFTKKSQKKIDSLGLSTLFEKIFTSNLKIKARDLFIDVLKCSKSIELFYFYIEKLYQMISNDSYVCDSILTLLEVIKINPEAYFSVNRSEVFLKIDEKFNGLWSKIENFLNLLLLSSGDSQYSQTDGVKIAMKLWKFMVKFSNDPVTIQKVMSFHEMTLKSPLDSAEASFLQSLRKMLKRNFDFKLKDDLMTYFFLEAKDLRITQEKFDLFYELFIQINNENSFIESHDKEIFSRNSDLLVGYDCLTNMFFNVQDQFIHCKCLETLIALNMKLNRSILQHKSSIWTRFLNLISENLEKDEVCANKALNLLNRFLDKTTFKAEGPLNAIVKFYMIEDKDMNSFEVNDKTTTIGHIKEKLSEFYSKPSNSIILSHFNTLYNYLFDDKLLITLKTPWVFLVNFDSRGLNMTSNDFLCNKEDFLVKILSLMKTFSRRNRDLAWVVLEKTWPITSSYQEAEELLLPFEQLMPRECLYTLVYNLKIIKTLTNIQSWLKVFNENEGFVYLINLFIDFEVNSEENDFLVLEYYSLTLYLIKLARSFPVELVDKVLQVLIHLSKFKQETEPLINSCIYSKEILAMIQKSSGEAYQSRFSCYPLEDLVSHVLINCDISILSGTISNFLLEHSNFTPSISSLIIAELLKSVPLALKSQNTDIYWGLVRCYINEIQDSEEKNKTFELLLNELKKYPPEQSSDMTDSNLVGLISAISIIIPTIESLDLFVSVLSLVFQISESSEKTVPKCKSRHSKKEAFDLIKKLISQSSKNLNYFISNANKVFKDLSFRTCRSSDWQISSQDSEKSISGFVGLKNLGCICYLNSCIQQLFNLQPFREHILSYPNSGVESLMYQLQFAFCALKNSVQQFFDPKELCNRILDWEGKPINVKEQQDADEFINSFLDNILGMIPEGNFNIVQELLCGSFITEIRGEGECCHFRRIQENFFTLPVQVKGHKRLEGGLLDFVAGEVLEGANAYQCDDCGKKVKAVRNVRIDKLPKVLILTLRRFEFNFDLMKRVKINDFCEFPLELDMKQLTVKETSEGLDEYFKYHIKGVLVHSGTAESGHYYSYIREGNDWFEFNDAVVMPFDVRELNKETFGGNDGVVAKQKSAYLLFYERVNYCETLPKPLSSQDFPSIFEENKRCNQIRLSFSPEYIDFILELLSKKTLETTQFCISTFFTMIIRSSDMTRVVLFASSLKDILISSQEHSDWTLYLVSHPLVIKELFLDCPSLEKRKIMSGVIKTAIKSASSEGLCMFAYKWLSVLPKARVPQSFNFCNYFELLLSVIETNPDLVVLFSIQLRLFEYCNKDQVQVDHEEIEENMQEEVLGYSQKASTTTELSKSELGESFEHLFSCVTFCSIYYDSSQLEHLCNEQVFCYLFENCRNKAGCRSLASMYLALAHSDRKCFQLIVQLLIEKLRNGQSNELIQTGTNDKSYENSMKLMRLLYLLVMGFKPMNSEAIEQILNVLMKISCSKLEKKEDPYCILFYTKKMIAINLDIRKLAQKKMKNLRDLEGILSNLMQNTQGQGKDLTRLKYCIENFQVIRKLVKNEVKNYFLEDSDTELKDFEISPGSELLHYNHEMSTWIKSTVTMNCEELICIRYENSSVQKWLDPQSDLLHRV